MRAGVACRTRRASLQPRSRVGLGIAHLCSPPSGGGVHGSSPSVVYVSHGHGARKARQPGGELALRVVGPGHASGLCRPALESQMRGMGLRAHLQAQTARRRLSVVSCWERSGSSNRVAAEISLGLVLERPRRALGEGGVTIDKDGSASHWVGERAVTPLEHLGRAVKGEVVLLEACLCERLRGGAEAVSVSAAVILRRHARRRRRGQCQSGIGERTASVKAALAASTASVRAAPKRASINTADEKARPLSKRRQHSRREGYCAF